MVVKRGIVACLIPLNISIVTYFSKEVGFNPAVMQSFNSLSGFTTALAFYFFYGENLKAQHIVGMILIVASVFIVSIFKSSSPSDADTPDHSFLALSTPFFLVFTTCLLLTYGTFLSRACRELAYPSKQFCVDFCCASGLFYLAGFIYVELFVQPFEWELCLFMTGAGVAIVEAFLLLNAGILSGKGALVITISQT